MVLCDQHLDFVRLNESYLYNLKIIDGNESSLSTCSLGTCPDFSIHLGTCIVCSRPKLFYRQQCGHRGASRPSSFYGRLSSFSDIAL